MSVTPNQRQYGSTAIIQVGVPFTGTALGAVWSPAAGKRIVLKGCALRARVTTVLAGATPGDHVFLCDNAVGTPLVSLGAITSATEAAGKDFGLTAFDFDLGYPLAAVGNILRVTTASGIGTGVINVTGFVWGDES